MSSPLGGIDPNRIALNRNARLAQEQHEAEQARLDAARQREEAEARRRLEEENRRALEASRKKRSGGGSTPSWFGGLAEKRGEKAEQDFLFSDEGEMIIEQQQQELFSQLSEQAETGDIDLANVSFRSRVKDGQLITEVISAGGVILDTSQRVKITGSGEVKLRGGDKSAFVPGNLEREYVDPNFNTRFGDQKIGDIVRQELARGDEGLYGGREVYDQAAVDRFTKEYSAAMRINQQYGAADMPIMVPASGIRSRSITEGFGTYGEKWVGGPYTPPRQITIHEKPITNDPVAGFVAPFSNVYEAFKFNLTDLFAGRKVPRYSYDPKTGEIISKEGMPDFRPEAEGDLIGATIQSGISTFQGKPTAEPIVDTVKGWQQAPAYFAGSVAGSALLWLGPGIGFKLAKIARPARALTPRARFDYDIRYGSFADRASVRFDRYNPTRWENPEALAELSKFRMPLDVPKSANLLPLATTPDSFQREISKIYAPDRRITTMDDILRGKAEREIDDVLRSTMPDRSREAGQVAIKEQAETAQIAALLDPTATKTEPIAKGIAKSKKSEDATNALLLRDSGLEKFIGLGGGASTFRAKTTLGLGGLTGAERKKGKISDFQDQNNILAYPPDSAEGSMSKFIVSSRSGQDLFGIQDLGLDITSALKNLDIPASRTDLRSNQGLDLGFNLRTENLLTPTSALKTDSALALDLGLSLRTAQTFRFAGLLDMRIPGRTPRRPPLLPPIPFFGFGERKRKKGKRGKRRSRYSEFEFDPVEIFPGTLLAKSLPFRSPFD